MDIANVIQEPVSARDFLLHIPVGLDLPTSVDLRKFAGDIEDQGRLGSCTANATVSALEMMMSREGRFVHLSRLFVYFNERESYANLRGKDGGAYLSDGFKSCYKFGVPHESVWPYVEGQVNTPPTQHAYDVANASKVSRYQRVAQFASTGCVERIKAALAMGYAVTVAIPVCDSLYYMRGALQTPGCLYTGAGKPIGGHALNLVGYTGTGFITENSWGAGWGDLGYCVVAYSVIGTSLMDAWCCTAFAGIVQEPNFSFTITTPLTASMGTYPYVRYLDSSKDSTLQTGLIPVTADGDAPLSYRWESPDEGVVFNGESSTVNVTVHTGTWAPNGVRSVVVRCTVQDSSIPAQEAVATTLIRICNGVQIESDYGKVYRLYTACLSRAPDASGIAYWVNRLRNGMELLAVADCFIYSVEFLSKYAGVSDKEFVALLYANVLGRAPDAGGYDYWVGRLTDGCPRNAVVVYFSESPENKLRSIW